MINIKVPVSAEGLHTPHTLAEDRWTSKRVRKREDGDENYPILSGALAVNNSLL